MIHNLHILINPDTSPSLAIRVQEIHAALLIEAHRRGEHPYGEMRRDCPLCQLNK